MTTQTPSNPTGPGAGKTQEVSSREDTSGTDRLKSTADDAKRAATATGEDIRGQARAGLEQAKDQAVERSEAAKSGLARELGSTADALETAAGEMREHSVQHELLHEAANGLTGISRALEGKSVGDIVADLSNFGRRNPAAFLGGAALAGFALARFAQASASGGSNMSATPSRGSAGYQPRQTTGGDTGFATPTPASATSSPAPVASTPAASAPAGGPPSSTSPNRGGLNDE